MDISVTVTVTIRILVSCMMAAVALPHAAPACAAESAKDYPNRPIRMLVPNAPGSSVDTLSRITAAKLGEVLRQQVVVDNRAGAGGVLGMEIGKHATPDGYTLVSAPTAAVSIAPLLQQNLPYDPVNDYAYISMFAVTPNVLVVTPALPIKSVQELIEYARAKQGQINMASAGPGSQSHLSGALLLAMGNFPSLHVPYKGGGPSVAAVIAGEAQWTITPAPAVMSLIRGGRLRAIAHSLPRRSSLLGDLPAVAETVPGYDYSGWQGLLAPKATPRPILDKLRAALIETASLPEVKAALAAQATEAVTSTPQEFRKLVQESLDKNRKVIKAIGLKVE